jgi:sulfonate transport system substrate-binding protein
MRPLRAALSALLLLATAIAARPAAAADGAVRIARPLDLLFLPLIVMQHEHLIERTAEAMGLGTVKVTWSVPGEEGALAALASGDADLAAADLAPFLVAADATSGTPGEVRALGALAQRPYILVVRNPAIHTILDFGAHDRIAVPALKTSGPALMLEMAASQQWGPEHYDKLDRLVVARPDAAASEALLSGKGDIDAHFSRTPYADEELADTAIHRVMDSFDIAGPHTSAVLAATSRFAAANPELCKAILSALQHADDVIKKSPGAAAEMFAGIAKDRDISIEDLADLIGDPDLSYQAAPAGAGHLAEFMHRLGRLRHKPAGWRELFLPASRDLPGS